VIIFSCSRERDGNWRRSSRRLLEPPPTWFLSCLSNKEGTVHPMIYVPGNLRKWNGVTLRIANPRGTDRKTYAYTCYLSVSASLYTQRSFG
jgi:hypothetical protein